MIKLLFALVLLLTSCSSLDTSTSDDSFKEGNTGKHFDYNNK